MKWLKIRVVFSARSPTMVCFYREVPDNLEHSQIAQYYMPKFGHPFFIGISEVAE